MEETFTMVSILFKIAGFFLLSGATCLMLRESTCEFKYLMSSWKEESSGMARYVFLLFVVMMYILSLFPIGAGFFFIMYGRVS